ncbi:glycosaminoglycan xylosylkinase [Engraulis encrasicolus]|uniref:glycosaminoglycan xylosylkinase n=1 Tax=Engraulis encrasicolus TaxID=184585 RepID=UPI002FD41543
MVFVTEGPLLVGDIGHHLWHQQSTLASASASAEYLSIRTISITGVPQHQDHQHQRSASASGPSSVWREGGSACWGRDRRPGGGGGGSSGGEKRSSSRTGRLQTPCRRRGGGHWTARRAAVAVGEGHHRGQQRVRQPQDASHTPQAADMKLKQRVVVLCAVLLLLGLAKVFLLDGGEGSAASRRDLRAFRKMEAGLALVKGARLTHTLQSPWEVAAQWVGPREVYPDETPELAAVLTALATARVERADVGYKGTQLKALLVLDGGQKVVFKPKRYSRDYVVEGEPYAGYDRHNAEVAAFHLDRILGFRRAPLVVGRLVNLRTEIKPVATDQLVSTFLMQGNNTCFYGKCYYCRESEPACAEGEVMEGSVTLWLPDVWPLQKHRHPWGRTYREGKLARWEYDDSYCEAVKKMPPYDAGPRLLDVIDTAIFDYLIGNADRHHYESFQDDGGASMLILLDNAKSFGNAALDERSILAPLYQCCMVRVSTWNRLNLLAGGVLSGALRQATAHDPVSPVLAEPHLAALDRRLAAAIATVRQCMETQGPDNTLIEDRMNLPHP